MKRISSLSFLLRLAGAVGIALSGVQAQDSGYRYVGATNAPATLNDVTFDGTSFWIVGAPSEGGPTLLRSGELGNAPGFPDLRFLTLPVTGAGSSNLTAIVGQGGFLYAGSGSGDGLESAGVLFRLPQDSNATSAVFTAVPESPTLNFGQVTDLTVAGPNLIRLGNRFAVGRHSLANLASGTPPLAAERTADISPFFEDYRQATLVGTNLFFAGSYVGGELPQGAVSLSINFGVNNAPSSGVTLFGTNETARIITLGSDGLNLYAGGTNGFIAALENAATISSLPAGESASWIKGSNAFPITAIAPYAGALFVADAQGIHRRGAGAAFVNAGTPEYTGGPIRSLAFANAGPLQDIVVGVGGTSVVYGGPIPAAPMVTFHREHFIVSDGANPVQVVNLTTANTVTTRSIAYDFYKSVNGSTGAVFLTVGPLRDQPGVTGFDLATRPTSEFSYGTNDFVVVARDVRTGITSEPVSYRVFRWPNPQPAQLGRSEGAAETNHFFQLGFGYSGVTSFLFKVNQPLANNGIGQPLDVNVGLANWFRLNAPVGQSVNGANVIQPAASLTGASTQVANQVDRFPFESIATLPPGVHTFAAQSIARFPTAAGQTNSLATNVTLFNVVILARPTAPRVSFLQWEVGACQGTVLHRLLPTSNGDWTDAMANPAGTPDARLVANITRANWLNLTANSTSALLPISPVVAVTTTNTFDVQSISDNRDGGVSLSDPVAGVTRVTLITRPIPQPPGLAVANLLVATDGIPAPANFNVVSGGSLGVQVGETVVTTVRATPTVALENILGSSRVEWSVTPTSGAAAGQPGATNTFDNPFDLQTTSPGLYTLTARTRNQYSNVETNLVDGALVAGTVITDCASPGITTLAVEVRARPLAPAVTVAQVGIYQEGEIRYQGAGNATQVVIGEQADRPVYSVTRQEVAGIGGFVSTTADWARTDADGNVVGILSTNTTSFQPTRALTQALGNVPVTNRFLVFARSTDGSLSAVPTAITLIVTPRPARPDVLAGEFFTYEDGVLVLQTGVPVLDGGVLTVADSLTEVTNRRPRFSMTAQANAQVADWYVTRSGTNALLALGQAEFLPSPEESPQGTNQFFAIARSLQGSESIEVTTFTLVVTPPPDAPLLSAEEIVRYDALGNIQREGEPVDDNSRLVIPDSFREHPDVSLEQVRPLYRMTPMGAAITADWYVIRGGSPVLILTNSLGYRPALSDSAVGTNTFQAVARSVEGGSSVPVTFQLVVTPAPASPALSAESFYTFADGVLTLRSPGAIASGSTLTVADTVGDEANRRPVYRMAAQAGATNADWYIVLTGTNQIVAKNTATFRPTPALTPVGSHRFLAVARSTEGGASVTSTEFTLVVTAVPAAPNLVAGDFLRFVDGVPTLQTAIPVLDLGTLVLGDDLGDPTRRRPVLTLTGPAGVSVVDWYQTGPGGNQLVASNQTAFRPTIISTPVGTNRFLAIGRSAEGASSVATRFDLVVTAAPTEPLVIGTLPVVSADGLVITLEDVVMTPGATVEVGSQAVGVQFTVAAQPGLAEAFTRWSVNGVVVATNSVFAPVLAIGDNVLTLQPFSPEGTAGAEISYVVAVSAPLPAPTVANDVRTVGECNTVTTFTAVAPGAASIVWTAGPTTNSTRLRVASNYETPALLKAVGSPFSYYAWAVSPSGDWSLSKAVVLTVVEPPPPAQLTASEGTLTPDGTTYRIGIPAGSTNYPNFTVSNAIAGDTVLWMVGGMTVAGTSYQPTTAELPATNVTHVITVALVRAGCTNAMTALELVVTDPVLRLTVTNGLLDFHLISPDTGLAGRAGNLLSAANLVNLGVAPVVTPVAALGAGTTNVIDGVSMVVYPVLIGAPEPAVVPEYYRFELAP